MRCARNLDIHKGKHGGRPVVEVVPLHDWFPPHPPELGAAFWTRGGLPKIGVVSHYLIPIGTEKHPAVETARRYLEIVKDVLRRAGYS